MSALDLTERRNWVGASEIAALLDASPYQSRYTLWHIKAGLIDADSLDDSERVLAGQFLEPGIAAWANHKWGWDLEKSPVYTPHPRVAGMGASLDYFSRSTGAPVDIKNVDGLVFRDEWISDGDHVIDAPDHLVLQIQAQMACTGASHGWLVAAVAGNRLVRFRIERHEPVIARLEAEVEAFWESIRANKPPKADYSRDLKTISSLYRGGGGVVDLTSNNRIPVLCSVYLAAHADVKEAEGRKESALAEIKEIVGDASKATIPGYSISVADIAGSEVSYVREPYRRFTIKEKKS